MCSKMSNLVAAAMLLAAGVMAAEAAADGAAPVKEQAAMVAAVRGDVQAIGADGVARLLAVKASIYRDDTIKTSDNGRLQLVFTDNTVVNLGPKSELKVEKYAYKPEARQAELVANVKRGGFQVKAGEIGKTAPQNFKTVTPSGTIGIRGSIFAGMAQAGALVVAFLGGQGITVSNEFGQVEITTSGFGTQVTQGQPPQAPAAMPVEQIMELRSAFFAGGGEEGGGGPEPGAAPGGMSEGSGTDVGDAAFDSGMDTAGTDIISGGSMPATLDSADAFGSFASPTAFVDATLTSGLNDQVLQNAQQDYGFGDFDVLAAGVVRLWEDIDGVQIFHEIDISSAFNRWSSHNDISGYLYMYEADEPEVYANVAVGGPLGSTYQSERDFTAGLGGYYYTPDNGGETFPLIPQNPGVWTAPLSQQWCEYATWGYWQMSFAAEVQGYVNVAEGTWIGGKRTAANEVQALCDQNVTATYSGGAHVAKFMEGTFSKIAAWNGTSSLTVNFQNANPNFSGTLNFSASNGPIFYIEGGVMPGAAAFSGTVTGVDNTSEFLEASPSSRGVQGMFCGPNAKTAAGYFYATTTESVNHFYYTGVFGGNR